MQTMPTLSELLIAETTEYEFKSELEVKRPKSWLKTVSAFANGLGGSFFFGVDDDGKPVGLADVKETSDQISRLIKERISPLPEFNLTAHHIENDKNNCQSVRLYGQFRAEVQIDADSVSRHFEEHELWKLGWRDQPSHRPR
jgi:predicted HTH transcriptional regulator